MPRLATHALLAVVLAALLLLTAGCEDARDEGALRVALTGQYPPFSFYDDDGELAGFDVDVAEAIGRELGTPVVFTATAWDGIIAGLQVGRYDAIIGSMAVTPQREQAVLFSQPYYVSGAQLFVHERHADEIRSLGDVGGHSLGVVTGETFQQYLEDNHPQIDIRGYRGTPLIFQALRNEQIAGFVSDRLVGLYQIRDAQQPLVPVGDLLYTERMAIPVHQNNHALLERINAALETLKESGELATIHQKWFGMPGELDPAAPSAASAAQGQ